MILTSTPKNINAVWTQKPRLPLDGFNEDAARRSILAGTATKTGKPFLVALVKNLALTMKTCGAWVTEYIPESRRLRALAFWFGGKLIPEFEHPIAGTACEAVIDERRLVHIADNIFELFPHDYTPDLKKAGVVSYMGVPLLDVNGNAGMMVTATKSILTALRDEPDLVKVFKRSNEALKRVNLHRHYMALQMIKLMSDGFSELFNAGGEIFDDERVKATFAEIAPQSPQQIIEHFVRAGKAWANGETPRDDVTFVVLKVR